MGYGKTQRPATTEPGHESGKTGLWIRGPDGVRRGVAADHYLVHGATTKERIKGELLVHLYPAGLSHLEQAPFEWRVQGVHKPPAFGL